MRYRRIAVSAAYLDNKSIVRAAQPVAIAKTQELVVFLTVKNSATRRSVAHHAYAASFSAGCA